MANVILWQAAWTTSGAGSVLTTELNSLANAGYSAAGTEIDNSSALNQYAILEVYCASFTPTAGGYLTIYMVTAPDGTNYAEGSASIDPGADRIVAILPLRAATGVVRKHTGIIPIPPAKMKFILLNSSGAALAATGNTVTMYVSNDEVQ